MEPEFSRTEMLLGREAMNKLAASRVAVFGIGGVGSYVVEGLARSGVGSFFLVDSDVVEASNPNRQLIATHRTIGHPKVDVERARILDINPHAVVETRQIFYLPETAVGLLPADLDYIVDAMDTVAAKIDLIVQARALGIPIISCMGTGNKLDPTRLEINDIYQTQTCPLSRVMRRELKKRGVAELKVLFSREEPLTPRRGEVIGGESPPVNERKRHVPGSVAFVPSVAGLIIAGEVVRDLIRDCLPG